MAADMRIGYQTHTEEWLELGVEPLNYLENDVRDWMWARAEKNGHVQAFYREPREMTLPVGICADTEEDGLRWRNEVARIADVDVMAQEPGRLWIGDWWMECYITGCSFANYWFDERTAEMALTIVSDNPIWRRGTVSHFYIRHDDELDHGARPFLDYPHDMPFDYCGRSNMLYVDNAYTLDADFQLTIYGPAVNPYVQVGWNIYEVDISLQAGEYLVVDSLKRTITMVDARGNASNAFSARKVGRANSGSYVFQKVRPGVNPVSWPNSFNWDFTVFEERSTPTWRMA